MIPESGSSPGEMAPHSSILAWKIPWTEELGELQSMQLQTDTAEDTHRFFKAQRLAYYMLFAHTLILYFHYPCTFSIIYR